MIFRKILLIASRCAGVSSTAGSGACAGEIGEESSFPADAGAGALLFRKTLLMASCCSGVSSIAGCGACAGAARRFAEGAIASADATGAKVAREAFCCSVLALCVGPAALWPVQ